MKTFKKAELLAKNLPTGSYAAGCPSNLHKVSRPKGSKTPICSKCEKKA